MITREQVADLQPGDVVELRDEDWPDTVVAGPLVARSWGLTLGDYATVRNGAEGLPDKAHNRTLTVVSRAPRPLYVNHPRTEPVPGDVVRDADRAGAEDPRVWFMFMIRPDDGPRWSGSDGRIKEGFELPTRLRLLVDGETGQVVQ